MTLHQPLYLMKIEDKDVVLQPVLFKTVRDGKEYFLWNQRTTVFKLKLMDVIAYQRESYKGSPSRFRQICTDIIPPCQIDADISVMFGLHREVQTQTIPPWKQTVYDYDKYLQKLNEADESENDTVSANSIKPDSGGIKDCSDSQIGDEGKITSEASRQRKSSSTYSITKTAEKVIMEESNNTPLTNTFQSKISSQVDNLVNIGNVSHEDAFWQQLHSKMSLKDQRESIKFEDLFKEIIKGLVKNSPSFSTFLLETIARIKTDIASGTDYLELTKLILGSVFPALPTSNHQACHYFPDLQGIIEEEVAQMSTDVSSIYTATSSRT